MTSLNGCTVSAVTVMDFPLYSQGTSSGNSLSQAEKTQACSHTYVQELCFSASAGATLSPRPHTEILSMKAFYQCIFWYFVRLSRTSGPLTENISTTADPQQVFFKYPPHACHQQITQENTEKGYKAVVLLGQQIATVLFFHK